MINAAHWDASRRFGLFLHWGVYALSEFHEQYQFVMQIPREEYEQFPKRFNPTRFDAREIVSLAKSVGMRYLCVTSKHHDGFCMWDTDETDYKVTNTPFGRDVVGELAAACAEQDMAFCLYYSIPDWHHPNAYNPKSSHQIAPRPTDEPDMSRYIAYIKRQITELLTRYGKISALFWDIPPQIHDPSVNELVRKLQPEILINDRGFSEGDYSTPERTVPDGKSFDRPAEAGQSVGRMSWGYRRDEDYFADRYLTGELDKILAMGGNYLLNVGPMPDGSIPPQARGVLTRVGDWYQRVAEAFEGAVPFHAPLGRDENPVTRRGDTLYIHFPSIPICGGLILNPLTKLPKECILLNDGRRIETALDRFPTWVDYSRTTREYLHVKHIPVNEFAHEPIVLKLVFDSLDGLE